MHLRLRWLSPGVDEIPAQLIKARCRTVSSEIHKLIHSVWNKEELSEEWKMSIIVLIYRLFTNFEKAYDSVRREILYNILIEFGIFMKLVRLIKMCVNETFSRVRVGKHFSDMFPIKCGLKHGNA